MLLTIHDANLRKVAFIDNDKQTTLNYFNDTWTRYLETGSSTFDFTVFKKAIISDAGRKRAYNYLSEKAFVSFQYKGKTYLHTIRKIEENEQVIKCYGINLNLELINEYANPYKAPKAMTFEEYCDAMDLLNFTFLKIGINEISTQKISAEWEGTGTKLNRLLSLANKFGAEIEFDTYLNADSSIKSFVVNVYHEHDDTHQGVGRISPTILKYGKNLKTLTRTVDKTNIYNMVRPTGRDDQGNTITIGGLGAWSVNNANGEREFYQAGEGLYAPISMQMYPAAFTRGTMGDQWIRKDMTVESANPEVIRSAAYRELKKNCYPAVTYDADGFADLDIGDTVQVYDDGFSPTLLLEMRVSEQAISFTNPKNNKTTFSNAKALENRLSGGIQQRIDQMVEDAKPYIIKLATDNGVIFKNQTGQIVVTPTLYKGGKVISNDVSWRWTLDGNMTTGMNYLVKGSSVTDTVTLTVAAYIGNNEVAVDEISFVNVFDGENGEQGIKGADGKDGKSFVLLTTHYKYPQNLVNLYGSSGYTGTWNVIEDTRNIKAGDSVQLQIFNTDKNSPSWIVGVVEDIPNLGALTVVSKGLIEKGERGALDEEQVKAIKSSIDTKADNVLTQEQLNTLNEKAQIQEAELKAKASMEALSNLEKAYNAFVANNAKATAQSEKDLIEAGRRIELLTTQFGGLKELKTFIDTYMTSSNEGLIIGKNDASSTIKVSSDRISMFSAGKEVMYISQGVIHIDNGIFTASVQIGKFRTEQYHLNADMNVIIYVG